MRFLISVSYTYVYIFSTLGMMFVFASESLEPWFSVVLIKLLYYKKMSQKPKSLVNIVYTALNTQGLTAIIGERVIPKFLRVLLNIVAYRVSISLSNIFLNF